VTHSAALIRDAAALVAVPSVTGTERPALELLAGMAADLGLESRLREYDLHALRSHPGHPGQEAPREELVGLTVTLPGRDGVPRLCLNGHVDVVAPGTREWARGPWSGAVEGGRLHGRGSVDMKGGVVAALHAMAAAGAAVCCEVVLEAVASEEDGGLGTFAALQRDDRFDACLIPEPTGFDVVCAQAGALTFSGVVRGRAAHAAVRLAGESAIDAYLPVHAALAAHELTLNSEVEHPLMAQLELPYPVSVGRIDAGEWSSSVPDRLRFEGRLGVRVGQTLEEAEAGLRAALEPFDLELSFTGGRFASGETPTDHPFARLVAEASRGATRRDPRFTGVPYGADMRQFTARGIPCVMCGTPGLERAHATNEYVETGGLTTLANLITGVITRFGRQP
jgi:acetylornithine deacetylase